MDTMDTARQSPLVASPSGRSGPADRAYAAFLSVQRFANLDGLRGLSILAVLWHHAGIETSVPLPRRG
jgi:hypothetical protein